MVVSTRTEHPDGEKFQGRVEAAWWERCAGAMELCGSFRHRRPLPCSIPPFEFAFHPRRVVLVSLGSMTCAAIRIDPAGEAALAAIQALAGAIWRACYAEIISAEQIEYMLRRMYAIERLREEIGSQQIHYDCLFDGDERIGFASYGPEL